MGARIVTLPGDGVGPEVTSAAVGVLKSVARVFGHSFQFAEYPFGGTSIDLTGIPLTEATLAACANSDAVLLGAIGGPKWDGLPPDRRPEAGLLALRKRLKLFANIRPVKPFPSLLDASPIKAHLVKGVDMVVIRELTGGLYFGEPKFTREEGGTIRSVDTLSYTAEEIERIARLAFRIAGARRKKVTVVDKANVLETSRLWRRVVEPVARAHSEITLEFMLVDTAAMRLVSSPGSFDVLLTENMFGDILTDEASVLLGSLGMAPSASVGADGPGVYEPIHGSAPDIAGRGMANPIGAILSAAMLLRYGLRLEVEAATVEQSVGETLESGMRTSDLGGRATTVEIGDRIAAGIRRTQ